MLAVKVDSVSSEESSTRTRILEAACDLLEAGDPGVSMLDIARHAGLSRQTVYIQFGSRSELLIAATRYVDQKCGLEQRLLKSRQANSGIERLNAYIEFWGNYVPEIQGLAGALLSAPASDAAAAAAWNDRMLAHRDGCRAAIEALINDGALAAEWTLASATQMLMMLLSVRTWALLRDGEGYTSADYIRNVTLLTGKAFLKAKPCSSR